MKIFASLAALLSFAAPIASKPHGGGACATDDDCQLNGRCSSETRTCVCDAAWTGKNCSYLNSFPSAGSAYRMKNASSWGGRATLNPPDGLYHAFFSEFGGSCGMIEWDNTSHIVHAVSSTPNPRRGYRRVGVAVPQYAHCVDPVMLRDNKTWLLFHNGDGSTTGVCPAGWPGCGTPVDQGNKDGYVADCSKQAGGWSNGTTPDPARVGGRRAPPPPPRSTFEPGNGVHVSRTGPAGPWKAGNATAAEGGYPFDDCPAVHVLRNNSIATWSQPLYPGNVKPMYVADLDEGGGWRDGHTPFRRIQPTIRFPQYLVDRAKEGGSVIKLDDPTMWVDRRGYWHVLAHNGDGPFPCGDLGPLGLQFRDGNPNPVGCSAHLYSRDGMSWTMSPVAAHNASVAFSDGSRVDGFRERPKVLVTAEGDITHLFSGIMLCGENPKWYPSGWPNGGHCIPQRASPDNDDDDDDEDDDDDDDADYGGDRRWGWRRRRRRRTTMTDGAVDGGGNGSRPGDDGGNGSNVGIYAPAGLDYSWTIMVPLGPRSVEGEELGAKGAGGAGGARGGSRKTVT